MKSVAIIGSGPAALMAAYQVAIKGHRVCVYEKKSSPGKKFLIAGSSGLNITNSASTPDFLKAYSNYNEYKSFWEKCLKDFSPMDWIKFIENLDHKTFLGTSNRYFIKEMKASKLLQSWITSLKDLGVEFFFDYECIEFNKSNQLISLKFSNNEEKLFDAACFCLGGGSYEPNEKPLLWPNLFISKNIRFKELQPSNVGFEVHWSKGFLKEAEGLPLKNISLKTSIGSMMGDLIITQYGLEGTPVYTLGTSGTSYIDLKPDLNIESIFKKLNSIKENLSPIRKVKKALNLCKARRALIFHHSPELTDLKKLVNLIKYFPIELIKPHSIDSAISTSGGVCFSEITQNLMLKKYPGVFLAGEMLDWSAPTGGFLIQGCVSQGALSARGISTFLESQLNEH